MPIEMRTHLSSGGADDDSDLSLHQKQHQHQQQDENGQWNGRSRPVSYYDNFKDTSAMIPGLTSTMSVDNMNSTCVMAPQPLNENNRLSNTGSAGNVSKVHGDKDRTRDSIKAPSMANCMSTTVPVNLAASQISGRHTPTRSSLRHSRMIVMHRHGTMSNKSRPPLFRHRKIARTLAVLQTIFGIVITSMSLCLLLWTPNLPSMDNPYWSGMPLLLSGSFIICLLCCFKKEYTSMNPGYCLTSSEIISVILATSATITCFLAFITSTVHLIRLTGLECSPPRVRNATCACRVKSEMASPSEPILKYIDLNCPEVEGIFTILLIFSAACNAFGTLISCWYCYLHWSARDKRPKYVKVRTTTRSSTHGSNSRSIYNPNLSGR